MKKALFIAVVAAGIVVVFACVTAFAEDNYEKYQKYMHKYYKHLEEAEEERCEGDWDDYHEEMEKARKDWCKAQKYLRRTDPYWGYPDRHHHGKPYHYPHHPTYPYREYRYYGYRSYPSYPYYGGGWGCRKKRDFFLDLDLDIDL